MVADSTLLITTTYEKFILLTQTTGQRWLFKLLPAEQAALCLSDFPTAQFVANDEYKGDLIVPSSFSHEDVTYTVTLISSIGDSAPCYDLTAITIPNTVRCLDAAFSYYCPALSEVKFQTPSSLDSIMYGAFYALRNLKTFDFPNSLKYIGQDAFRDSGLEEVTISSNVSIDESAFSYCFDLQSVTLPEGMDTIKPFAFAYCPTLSSVQIPQSVKVIDFCAFSCDPLVSITLPDSLVRIGINAFSYAAISSIKLPESLRTLGGFGACPNLTEVTIPSAVSYLEYGAFVNCSHLNKVTCLAPVPPRCAYDGNVFEESPLTVIYVPNESLEAYLSAPVWSDYADIIQPIP
ncbi:MAG: leucine-rich repeat domain-containing protein [Bacteroidales bacterium]|nr:leucine-rich repeat domain-containing protein [Bacteroidales bacterium]